MSWMFDVRDREPLGAVELDQEIDRARCISARRHGSAKDKGEVAIARREVGDIDKPLSDFSLGRRNSTDRHMNSRSDRAASAWMGRVITANEQSFRQPAELA
jgi:hypothetical protein